MDMIQFSGKLLEAYDDALREHKNAKSKYDYIYTMGQLDTLKKIVEWLKE